MGKMLPIFNSSADFQFPVPNSTALELQKGSKGISYVTASRNFHRQVVQKQTRIMRELGSAKIRTIKVDRWSRYPYRQRSVLFILPPPAIGEHVAIRFFIEAFIAQAKPKKVAVLGSDAASDVYAGMNSVAIYPAWMPYAELKQFQVIIDFNDVPARREIEFWPVDMEASLYKLFGLSIPGKTIVPKIPAKNGNLSVGILALASSPIRTLPTALILSLIELLTNKGIEIKIVLNKQQIQSKWLRSVLDDAISQLKYVEDTRSVSDLQVAMRRFDYCVFADSGPAHLSKLDQIPGAAIFTSAPSQLLLGRHRNLHPIQIEYSSNFCEAPCGLAKLRQTADGRVGCMASLKTTRENLPTAVNGPDMGLIKRLQLEAPVPCVGAVADSAEQIASAIYIDIINRCL